MSQDAVILDLLNYWERLRAGRIAPMRSELDPREFRDALHYSFVLHKTRFHDLRIRLSGMSLNDLMGMELRGMPANALIAPDHRQDFDDILSSILANPHISELKLASAASLPNEPPTARMLLLPLCDDQGQVTRIMGAISLRHQIALAPCRFRIRQTKRTRIVATKDGEDTQPGLQEPPAPFSPPAAKAAADPQRLTAEMPTPPRPGKPNLQTIKGLAVDNAAPKPQRGERPRTHLRLIKGE